MKNDLPNITLPATGRLTAGWSAFWFTATNPIALNALRVLTGLLLLAWLLPLAGHIEALFGFHGWVDLGAIAVANRMPQGPWIGWSLLYPLGNNGTALVIAYWVTIWVFVCFTLGLWTRLTSVLTWVMVVSFLANPAARLEVDHMLVVLTFYLMIGYLFLGQMNGGLSFIERVLGPWNTFVFPGLLRIFGSKPAEPARPSFAANVGVRFLQVHFALIVVTSALHKLQFGDWWSGVGYWYPLHQPFETTEQMIRAQAANREAILFFLSLLQYIALAWQLSFPLWVWKRNCRPLLLAGGVAACLFSTFIYRDPIFGVFFFVGCLSYLSAEEWQRMGSTVGRVWSAVAGKQVARVEGKPATGRALVTPL